MSVPPTNAEADLAVPAAGTPVRALTNAFLKDLISTDALKSPIASPTFTGTPTAPTAAPGTNNTQLSTTAFVTAAIAALQANLGKRGTVRAASTANINLAAPGASIDGVTMSVGQYFIPKNQTAPAENGVYQWNGASTLATRATEYDTWDDYPGALIAVQEGTTQADTLWLCTSNTGGTLGTTAITFAQFSASGALLAANNLSDLANAATARTNLGLQALATVTPGTGVATWIATPSSANLRAAVTDETGDGSLVFTSSPVSLSANTNLDRANHGNRRLILTGSITLTYLDDTAGGWVAGDVTYGINAGTGIITLAPDAVGTTTTVTATTGNTLLVYPGQEFAVSRDGANAWSGGAEAPTDIVIPLGAPSDSLSAATNIRNFFLTFSARAVNVAAAVLGAQSTSGLPTFDLNVNGASILSTKLTIDANETYSSTAATPPVFSSTSLPAYSNISIDCDNAGTGAGGAVVILSVLKV